MTIKLSHPLPGAEPTGSFRPRPAFTENGVYVPAMLHNGQDYGAPTGTAIRAAHAGRVIWSGWDPVGGGWGIQLQHDDGWSTLYFHMSHRSTDVTIGQRVTTGQTIGRVGMSGLATGPHLHFMLRRNGQDIDPVPYIVATPALPDIPDPKPLIERQDMFIIKLKNGRWYLILPNGAGKMRATWLPSKSGATASDIPILDFKNATAEQTKQLRAAVDGI